ncbi:MAG: histidine kinase [Paenibacillaceae bacterium]|jgi:signal transduction histidine kinase|nr:histidine kinase [Paenibacillaceae bacterium]
MNNRPDSLGMFQEEHKVFEAAKAYLAQTAEALEAEQAEGLRNRYARLVDDYERLLKTSVKVARISDIQGRALMERENEIRVANESLKQMEIMRRELISDITHELGTPMTALQGYVKALLDGLVPLDYKYLQAMYSKVLMMNQLIDDLFDLAKLRGNRLSFQLRELLLEDLVKALSRFGLEEAAQKGVALLFHPPQQAPDGCTAIIVADLIRVEQVMNNLLMNAIKFTPQGGNIQVSFHIEAAGADSTEPALLVEVCDTGPGIPEEELPHLFERFFRGSYTRQTGIHGSGLGLSIAKEIIANHNGTMGVRSMHGAGSTFYFRIPVQLVRS